MRSRILVASLTVALWSVSSVYGQVSNARTLSTTKEQSDSGPVVVTECQGVNNCATWTFATDIKGRKLGIGKWPTGQEAVLEISTVANNQVVITRTDLSGSTAGLTASYTGTRDAQGGVGGTYSSLYKGHVEEGHWYWVADTVPVNLHITECEGPRCAVFPPNTPVWNFVGMSGTGVFGTGNQPLTLEHIDLNSIQVRRTDTTGPWRGSAVYSGRIEGNRINGEVRYFDPNAAAPRIDVWTGIIGDMPTGTVAHASGQGVTLQQFVEGVSAVYQITKIWEFLFQ